MFKKSKYILAALAAAIAATSFSGCIGDTTNGTGDTFVLTKKYYNWNLTVVNNKWGKWGIFIGSCIIPVYQVCLGLCDALVLNSIQFWTGSNPMTAQTVTGSDGVEYQIVKTDTTMTITNLETNETVVFTVSEDGKTLSIASAETEMSAELVAENRAVLRTANGETEYAF